ncbi:putative ribonuclease H-like domain-containing protein [Tanacetum coccineum]
MDEFAVRNKLSEDQMVKTVFVFSDMEFDQASLRPWVSDYERFRESLTVAGGDEFLEGGGVINPEDVPKRSGSNPEETMEAAISGELYQKLLVCD